jgi:Ribbon-helix-helix protein, copG family
VNVRLTPEQLAALDAHIARLKEPVGRPEAIRRLIEKGLGKR